MSILEFPIITPVKDQKKENRSNASSVKQASSGCCGGSPVKNSDACCKLDEEKKDEGLSGCGCNSSPANTGSSSCC